MASDWNDTRQVSVSADIDGKTWRLQLRMRGLTHFVGRSIFSILIGRDRSRVPAWPDEATRLVEVLLMVKKYFGQTRINFRPKKTCREKNFSEFLGESEDFVANYHRHLSENSDK